MKLEIKEIDGVPVTGSPGRSRTVFAGKPDKDVCSAGAWGGTVGKLLAF